MSNFIKRTVPVIFVLVICITCLAFPAAASSFEVPSTSINILDYATPNNSSDTSVYIGESGTVVFDLPDYFSFNYIDIVFSAHSYDVTSVKILGNDLTLDILAGGMFRAYGQILSTGSSKRLDSISLDFVADGPTRLNFLSFNAYNEWLTPRNICGSADIYYNGIKVESLEQPNPSETVGYTFGKKTGSTVFHPIIFDLMADDWKTYDYLAFRIRTDITVDSIVAMSSSGKFPLPYTSTVYNTYPIQDYWYDFYHYHFIIVDISSLRKDLNEFPVIQFYGHIDPESTGEFYLLDCTGFVNVEYVDPNLSFLRKFAKRVSDHFNSQFYKLEQILSEFKILNGSDSGGLSAQQKQEAINVSINNQLVGAVEDWNTNIEVVQAGYDLALTNVTPSLIWLSSLADGIFNGMGWFGSIYFLVGLISVIMLILSKSGLAHKIGNISRRGD